MIDPFGLRMLMGLVAGRLLFTGALVWKKLLVVPVSAMMEDKGSGGPTEDVDKECSVLLDISILAFFFVGFPPSQLVGRRGPRKPPEMVLLPPFILSAVASVLWPSFLLEHVALVCCSFLPSPCDQQ
jgi:hypothetical protein